MVITQVVKSGFTCESQDFGVNLQYESGESEHMAQAHLEGRMSAVGIGLCQCSWRIGINDALAVIGVDGLHQQIEDLPTRLSTIQAYSRKQISYYRWQGCDWDYH